MGQSGSRPGPATPKGAMPAAGLEKYTSLKEGFDKCANSFGYINVTDAKATGSIATYLGLDHDVVKKELKAIDTDSNNLVSFAEFALWTDRHTVGVPLGLDSVPDKREWREGMPAYWTSLPPPEPSEALQPKLSLIAAAAAPARGDAPAAAAPAAAAPLPMVVEDDSHLEDFVLAAKNFQWDKVWELLGRFPYYADKRPPYRRYAAIHQAACSGEVDVLQRLVKEFGASPTLPTKDGQTPLQVAQEFGNEEAAACLESLSAEHPAKKLKTGAADDAAAPDPALVGQANELIEKAKWAKWEDMFKLIEAHPQAVNVRPDYRVFGVIHQAAYHGELDVLKRLVHVGANPGLKTRDGHTALQVALKEAHGEVVAYLSSLKLPDAGDPGAPSEEQQAHAVIDAAKEGDWGRAFSLLDAGPAGLVNMRPEVRLYGVFHQAAYHGDIEVLRRLIEDYKANVKQLTKDGENALQIATSQNQEAAAKYLEACFPAIKLDDDFVTYPEQRFVTLSKAELVRFQDLLAKTHKKSDNWTRDRDFASGKFEFKTPVPSGYELVGVKRNENAPLWRIYQVAREVMRMECAKAGAVKPFETWTPKTAEGLDWPELKLCNDANEWLLWHAGLPEALSAIARTGFTMAKLGSGGTTGGGGLYGNGTYFADSITKADEYARRKVEEKGAFKGCRAVALVRVLGGRHYYTDKDVTEAQKPQFEKRVLEGHYHSTVGDRLKLKNTFREYVAYDASCTYLEFILYYKRKGVPKKHE